MHIPITLFFWRKNVEARMGATRTFFSQKIKLDAPST
jgi:hypothetical protein